MIGHQQIIQLRRQGRKPAAVFVHVGPEPTPVWNGDTPENDIAEGCHPGVWTGLSLPSEHDLRWSKGLFVFCLCDGFPDGWRFWWEALKEHAAQMYGIDDMGELVTWVR